MFIDTYSYFVPTQKMKSLQWRACS